MNQKQNRKKYYKVHMRPIASLMIGLILVSSILLVTMFEASGNTKSKISGRTAEKKDQEKETPGFGNYDSEMLAVVKDIDRKAQQVILFDINKQDTVLLAYTGASNITDKYGQVISASQIPIGTMVDVGYLKEKSKLIKMQISTQAWEYIGVGNMTIDSEAKIIKVGSTKYRYTDDIIIVDNNSFIRVADLAKQDELTVRGFQETIWSMTLTRGHGTVKLEDYEAFLGGNIVVGYESIQQITEDMIITVREGNFNLTVENKKYSGTKNITINRNIETVVTLGDLGPAAVKKSRITFEITPFGADLFIGGNLTSYANPIELEYGAHAITVSLGGYTSFQGTLRVDDAGKTIRIDLPEKSSNNSASVSVTDTETETTQEETSEDDWITVDSGTVVNSESQNGTGNEDLIIDEEHFIYVQNPIGASVYLNGEFKGISPGSFEKIIGNHVITFIKEGYETKSYTVEVANDGLNSYISLPDLIKIE